MTEPKRRSIITIQKRTVGRDALGQPLPGAWENVVSGLYANIRNMSGREAGAAGGTASTLTCSIRIRYREGITSGMRVVHRTTIYNIQAVLPDETHRRHVDLVCTFNLQNEG